MKETRTSSLRQELGWTQERLAAESGVDIRTVQRREAGHDASLETPSLVAAALRVPVRELFTVLDGEDFTSRVASLEARTEAQQAARDRVTTAWQLLSVGVGIVVTLFAFTSGQYGLALIASYWGGGSLILEALRTLIFEPRLDAERPLSHRRLEPAKRTRSTSSNAAGPTTSSRHGLEPQRSGSPRRLRWLLLRLGCAPPPWRGERCQRVVVAAGSSPHG